VPSGSDSPLPPPGGGVGGEGRVNVVAAGKPDQEFLTAKDAKHAKNQDPI